MQTATAQQSSLELTRLGVGKFTRQRAAHLLGRAIFCALLTLIALTAVPYGTVQSWWVAAFECGAFALAALWVVEGLLSGAWRVGGSRLLVPLFALSAYAFVQTLPLRGEGAGAPPALGGRLTISADPYETRLATLELLALACTLGLLSRYTSNQRRLRALIFLVLGIGVASALFGLGRQALQGDAPSFILPHLAPGRGYGQFINQNHFAFLMEMTLGLAAGLMVWGRGGRRDRPSLYLAAAVPVWAALVLSNSRGGVLGMLSQMLFLGLFFVTASSRPESPGQSDGPPASLARRGLMLAARVMLITGLIAGAGLGALWVGGDRLVHRMEVTNDEFSDEKDDVHDKTMRKDIWLATWQLIKNNPIAGAGFGGYGTAITEYHNASGKLRPRQAHNDYLDLAASGGLIGVALGLWFAGALILESRKRLRSGEPFLRAACVGALAGLFGVAVHSLVDFGLHNTLNGLVCVALVVIATANVAPRKAGRRGGAPVPPAGPPAPSGECHMVTEGTGG